MLQALDSKLPITSIQNERGQSAVEYLIMCAALVTLFITTSSENSIYNMISHTIHDKYSSYAFGVSISDPPDKAFDDKVKEDAAKVKEVLDELENIEDLISDIELPDLSFKDISDEDSGIINGFKTLVHDIKDLL